MNLEEKSINDLLRLNSQTIEELIKRGVLRTRNNPIGDYTEWIVSKKLNLVLEKNSKSGYDAIDKRGIKFQIKGRRIKSSNKSKQLGVIRNLQLKKFDYLVGLIFNENFDVIEAYKIPHEIIGNYARFSIHQGGHILYLKGEVLKDSETEDIINIFKNERMCFVGV